MASLKDSYRKVLADLLPQGAAWLAKNIVGSDLYKLLLSFGQVLNALHCRIEDLIRQFRPGTADELLDEWENELYGDDLFECIKDLTPDLQEKVKLLIGKARAIGGNRVEYYQEIACLFGFDVDITERFPTDFEAKFEVFPKNRNCDPYTKPQGGKGETVTLTTTAETLADLGITILGDTGAVKITFEGDITDFKKVARYWETAETPTSTVGQTVATLETLRLTREQALGFKAVALGVNVKMHITQYAYEFQLTKWNVVCETLACDRFAEVDFANDLEAYICLMEIIMPAQLKFNLFVDRKLYAIMQPQPI